ncbi:MAG: NUDIX hydrolase [Microcoleus sp. PH2017_10_PVI_O_A]|uniref:NUDIX hydrolase n=1 Tax=unclassified Microcoleus TaxID=2642155 RepID=UPI001DF1CA78|nr:MULTISPECIES: NUDIX hydrolase [unclassified Microcoleus]TAE79248.1 MAG: NUDIX hydrolase [Oscillatoriales cyanobacterium]MCC3408462.1 NUDIX hydrolase [Microcoleus sp. PH2017_10_PVI_O_A]MCC3462537.1 NUDIX hydrolase [Microcoleus sp. PH2017_11_PCY_U_A]MCC3480969.1 NUDIX hydrolase [Microcoleus sp. PH2017_12_PCY_D_A]MCC3561939.1 NUDIX hydrolase [Microcoleus sp. PH2017_27_LUM_O_A]
MKNLTKWKLLRSRLVLNHKWCQVRQDEIELPSGQIIDDFFINVRPNIALIFAVTEQQELVCVRQYRHGVGEILLELPAGSFNPAEESGKAAAARELAEETGYVAEEILELATLYDNPVKDTNSIYLYFGKNVKLARQIQLDVTEDIEIVLVPISEVLLKISNREICVAGSIAAIFLGLEFLKKQQLGW